MKTLFYITETAGIAESIKAPVTVRREKPIKCDGCKELINTGEQYFNLWSYGSGRYCLGCVKYE